MKNVLLFLLSFVLITMTSCSPEMGTIDFPIVSCILSISTILLTILTIKWIQYDSDLEVLGVFSGIIGLCLLIASIASWVGVAEKHAEDRRYIANVQITQQTINDARNSGLEALERAAVIQNIIEINQNIQYQKYCRKQWWTKEYISARFDTLQFIK